MIHIILLILKILGIILLLFIGLILLTLAVVLFVPIRYRVKMVKEEADGVFWIRGRVYWLLHAVSVQFDYDGTTICKVRILGCVVYDLAKKEYYAQRAKEREEKREAKEKAKKAAKRTKIRKKRTKTAAVQKTKKQQQATTGLSKEIEKETGTVQVAMKPQETHKSAKEDADKEKKTAKEPEKKKSFLHKIKEFFNLLWQKLKNIQYTILRFCDRMKQIRNEAEYYKNVLQQEESKAAFLSCKTQLARIWKNIRPAKWNASIRIGFDDPADTGQLLGAYSMFYPWVYHHISVEADFERSILQGTFFCKGRVTIFVLLKAAWIIYFDKNIRYFLRLWKKEETLNVTE